MIVSSIIVRVAFVFVMMFGFNVMTEGKSTIPTNSNYKLVWSDEFNSNAIDESVWNIEENENGSGNAELQYYSRDNVGIEIDQTSGESCLVLTAKKEQRGRCAFTSGRLNTANKLTFTHGKIESRIKMPRTANGVWPAFWLMGNSYWTCGWPRCGEIDIVEMGHADGIAASTQEKYFNGACHWGFFKDGSYPSYSHSITNKYSIQDGEFHLFTLVWDDKEVAMYLDLDRNPMASPYFTINISDRSNELSPGNYLHGEFFIVYNLAVGGYFTGLLEPSGITALDNGDCKMYVDYVRVYQQSPTDRIHLPQQQTINN